MVFKTRKSPVLSRSVNQLRGLLQQLQKDAEQAGCIPRLPGIGQWATDLGISPDTASLTFQALEEEGLLTRGLGRKYQINGYEDPVSNSLPKMDAVDAVYSDLSEKIHSGYWSWGSQLPKQSWLAREFHVSEHTIAKVCAQLLSEGLIHKEGRYFQTGRKFHSSSGSMGPRIVVLVTESINHWFHCLSDSRIGPFARTISELCIRYNIRIAPALENPKYSDEMSATLNGVEATLRFCQENQRQILGIVYMHSSRDETKMGEWLHGLRTVNKPILWFNRYGMSDESLGPNLCNQIKSLGLIKLSHEEIRFSNAALEYVTNRGHQTIFLGEGEQDWWIARKQILKNARPKSAPHIHWIEGEQITIEHFTKPYRSILIKALNDLLRRNGKYVAMTEDRLLVRKQGGKSVLKHFEQRWWKGRTGGTILAYIMGRIAKEKKMTKDARADTLLWSLNILFSIHQSGSNFPTVIIHPHDETAGILRGAIQQLNLRVPHDISVISYDNSFHSSIHFIDTVDPGFSSLGSKAIHILIDDGTVRVKKSKTIFASPVVVDRGTVKWIG